MKKLIHSLVMLGAVVGFAACSDSNKQADAIKENAEKQAEAVRENADQTASAIKENADQTADSLKAKAEGAQEYASDKADSVQAGAERKADAIEASADKKAEALKESKKNAEKKAEKKADSKKSAMLDRDGIEDAQKKLKELGYLDGQADGIIGQDTRSAVSRFQRKAGLPVTGNLDENTVEHLDDADDRLAE